MSWPEVEFESLFLIPSRNGVYKLRDPLIFRDSNNSKCAGI